MTNVARILGSPELGSHYQGQRAATESRYQGDADVVSTAPRAAKSDRLAP